MSMMPYENIKSEPALVIHAVENGSFDMQENVIRVKRVVSKIARHNRMDLRCPLPVWDSTGAVIGLALEQDKRMGAVECRAQATFTLSPKEYASEETIAAKAELAVAAMKAEILSTIRPKR